MKKIETIGYNRALSLKELGFDDECVYYHPDGLFTPSPMYQQAFRFLREKFGLWFVLEEWEDGLYDFHIYDKPLKNHLRETCIYFSGDFPTHEEAEDACLDKLIELANGK